MAGTSSQLPLASPSTRSSPVVNGNTALDYINGHGGLPDSPSSTAVPAPPAPKKGKGKKAADPNETGKLLAAKINQLELDAAGDKEQEAEIGVYNSPCLWGALSRSDMICHEKSVQGYSKHRTEEPGILVAMNHEPFLRLRHIFLSVYVFLPVAREAHKADGSLLVTSI